MRGLRLIPRVGDPPPQAGVLGHFRPTSSLLTLLPPYLHFTFTTLNFPSILPSFRVAMSTPFSDNNPPPPPPKQSSSTRRHHSTQQPTRSNTTRNDPSLAHHPSRSVDTTSRTRPARSQTAGPYVVTSSHSFLLSLISLPPLLGTVRPPIRPLVPSLPRRGVPILLTRRHQINRNHTAPKPRRLPYTPMSSIVSISLVLDRVCHFRLIQLPTLLTSVSPSVPP